jgi:hypothetical protein
MPNEEVIEKYGNLFAEVLFGLMKLLKFEDSVFILLNKSKTSALKNNTSYSNTIAYRKTIKIFFGDVVRFLGFNFFYNKIIFSALTDCITQIKTDMNNVTAWSSLEVVLYCFQAICKGIYYILYYRNRCERRLNFFRYYIRHYFRNS